MYVCEKCGWLYSVSHCPRCGKPARSDYSGEVTLSGYDDGEDSGTIEEREAETRELLWNAVHAFSPDPDECLALADRLRSFAPDDYYANFVDAVFSGGEDMTIRFLSQPRAKDAEMYAEPVLDYMCFHMTDNLYPAVRRYVERSDLAHPEKYEAIIERHLSDGMKKERDEAEEKKRKAESDRINATVRDAAEGIVKEIAERTVREAAERIVKEVAERDIREINERKERESREAEERERKEKEEKRKAEDERRRREQQETADRAEKEKREAEALKRKREEEGLLSADGFSKGFEFEKQGSSYVLTWIGDCEDTDIRIPPVYNGLSVTAIGNKSFIGCKDIRSVVIPSGVSSIGDEAFNGCLALKSVRLPVTLETIGKSTFEGDNSLETVDMPAATTIGDSAFKGCYNLSKLSFPMGLRLIGDEAFRSCNRRLNDGVVVIPYGVKSIGKDAFNFTNLSRIYIPLSVEFIGGDWTFFGGSLYYLGTESQWNGITKGKYFNKTVFFYSASRPRDLGHFWHYDENGNTVVW